MPTSNNAYDREVEWATVIKLYNYDLSAGASNVLRRDGLMYRLEALLPEIALPIRIHECRKGFGGSDASFDTNISGLTVRLERGTGGNLEKQPWDVPFTVNGLNFKARIYVFKKGKAKTYLGNQGIIFSINGQTHGYIPKTIFGRKKVGLTRIGKDLLVLVDCSEISVDAREDLFMSSRDRLSKGELRKAIEKQLEEILFKDSLLRKLQEERRATEQSEKLANEKPLAEVLSNILKSSPSLSALFLHGQRLNMPKKLGNNQTQNSTIDVNSDSISNTIKNDFIGKKHPTYLIFQKAPKTDLYTRNCEQGRIVRITLETDVENGYFTRANNPGTYNLDILKGNVDIKDISHSADLHDGVIQWSVSLPNDISIGEKVEFELSLDDNVLIEPLTKKLELIIKPKSKSSSKPYKSNNKSKVNSGDDKNNTSAGMDLPQRVRVYEGDENWKEFEFDNKSAIHMIRDRLSSDEQNEQYETTFYINMDNINLQNEMKNSKSPILEKAKYEYGNVLLGLSLIHDYELRTKSTINDNDNEFTIQQDIMKTSRALSPFILPMINYLGGLTEEDATSLASLGDDE